MADKMIILPHSGSYHPLCLAWQITAWTGVYTARPGEATEQGLPRQGVLGGYLHRGYKQRILLITGGYNTQHTEDTTIYRRSGKS